MFDVTSIVHIDTLAIVAGELTITSENHVAAVVKSETLVTSRKLELCLVFLQSFVATLVVILYGPVVFSQNIAVLNRQ